MSAAHQYSPLIAGLLMLLQPVPPELLKGIRSSGFFSFSAKPTPTSKDWPREKNISLNDVIVYNQARLSTATLKKNYSPLSSMAKNFMVVSLLPELTYEQLQQLLEDQDLDASSRSIITQRQTFIHNQHAAQSMFKSNSERLGELLKYKDLNPELKERITQRQKTLKEVEALSEKITRLQRIIDDPYPAFREANPVRETSPMDQGTHEALMKGLVEAAIENGSSSSFEMLKKAFQDSYAQASSQQFGELGAKVFKQVLSRTSTGYDSAMVIEFFACRNLAVQGKDLVGLAEGLRPGSMQSSNAYKSIEAFVAFMLRNPGKLEKTELASVVGNLSRFAKPLDSAYSGLAMQKISLLSKIQTFDVGVPLEKFVRETVQEMDQLKIKKDLLNAQLTSN